LPETSPGASPSHLHFERDRAGQAYLFVHSVSLLKDRESDTNRKIEILEGASSINLRVFLARRARVARISVSTLRMFKASDCGRLGSQAAGHPWSTRRVVKSCRKDCPTAKVLFEAKAVALHPERYQSLLSKLSTKREGEAGKRSAGNRIG
jgi:hypothetical protein